MVSVVYTDSRKILWHSKTMSRETGVNIETIRYYERIALMPKPNRTQGGNRQYNSDQLKRLSFIKKCRGLGFKIEEIRALLLMVDRQDFTCNQVHTMTIEHLENVKKKLTDLKRMEKTLKLMAAQCSRGDVPECPVIETLFKM